MACGPGKHRLGLLTGFVSDRIRGILFLISADEDAAQGEFLVVRVGTSTHATDVPINPLLTSRTPMRTW